MLTIKQKITIIITIALLFGIIGYVDSTYAASKYVKVKRTTYQKYQKSYKQIKKYKKTIGDYKATVKDCKATITRLDNIIDKKDKEITQLKTENYKKTIDSFNETIKKNNEIAELKEQLNSANSMNRWIWNSTKAMGMSYKNKTWTIPSEFPETFTVDGVTYKIVKE